MLPGLKVDERREKGGAEEWERDKGEEEDGEVKIPTPRKRLMNFKIPIINRGDQRRGQNASVVTRRRLFSEEGEWVTKSVRSDLKAGQTAPIWVNFCD